jgi:VanZ family protein
VKRIVSWFGWFGRWGPVVVYMAAIFVMSSIPGTQVPMPGLWRHDKLMHALAFAGLAVLVFRASRHAPGAVAFATAYGALDELHQRYTPHRSSDPEDLAADFAGACLGAVVALMWVRVRERRSSRAR